MSFTDNIEIGDLVEILSIDVANKWLTEPNYLDQPCPIGRIGIIEIIHHQSNIYQYSVNLGEMWSLGYTAEEIKLVYKK